MDNENELFRVGDNTKAMIELAISQGYQIGAIVMLRPVGGSCKYLFISNTALDAGVGESFSLELEAHGFPRATPDAFKPN